MEDHYSLFFAYTHIKITFRTSDSPFTKHYCEHRKKEYLAFLKKNYVVSRWSQAKVAYHITFYDLPISKTQIIHRKVSKTHGGVSHFAYLYSVKEKAVGIPYSVSTNHIAYILLTLLVNHLAQQSAFILHASSNVHNDELNVFVAPSGGGKSTIMRLLSQRFKSYSDEYLVIAKRQGTYVGTPLGLPEKKFTHLAQSLASKCPIRSLCFLRKSKISSIEKVNSLTAFHQLSTQLLSAENNEILRRNIKDLYSFAKSSIPFFQLSFPKHKSIVEFVEKTL